MTNGQAARLLQSPKIEKPPPVQKKEEEPPVEKAPKGGKNKLNNSMNKNRGTPGGTNSRAPSAQSVAPPPIEKKVESETESTEPLTEKTKNSSFEYFNMVMYGLPNLMSH